ncbi:MAG: DUF5615 family PIN-like protein [Tepidiformaceae bacterium]
MTLKFLADENFHQAIVRALLRHEPQIDIVTASEAGLLATPDTEILDWAAAHQRVVLTHDMATMRPLAEGRAVAGTPFGGMILVSPAMPIGTAVTRLLAIVESSSIESNWVIGQVRFV